MGDISELSGDLDCIFSLVRAEKVGCMVGVGGSELGWVHPRTSNNLGTVLRPDPANGRDAAVSL